MLYIFYCHAEFILGDIIWHDIYQKYFTSHTSLMVIMLCFFYQVRMAERSKAPDSRFTFSVDCRDYREFWSSYEGVGSNPTSDKIVFEAFYCTFPWFIMGSTMKSISNDENAKEEAIFVLFKLVITDNEN